MFGALAFCLVGRVAQARWRTLRADLAENITGPNRSPGPFLTDPMPPGFEMRASRQSGSAKNATPNHGKNKSIAAPSLIRVARPL